jgi:hypothetical protein
MGDHTAKPSDKIHVLILGDDEYIWWVASFADIADANAAAKIATEALRDDGVHSFYVQSYQAYPKGSVPTLDQIKSGASDHDCDEMWQLTVEERLDNVDPAEVVKEITARAERMPLFVSPITEAEFEALPPERRVAIADWVDDPYGDITDLPPELRPEAQRPIIPAPGQQELPIQ